MEVFPAFLIMNLTSDEKTFIETLYMKYFGYMRAVAMRCCHYSEDADDLISDAVVKLSEHVAKLRSLEPNALKMYIARTIRNLAINRGKRTKWLDQDEGMITRNEAERELIFKTTEEWIMIKEEIELIWRLIGQLPVKEQHALRMKKITGASDREIANALDLSEKSVAQYVRRAQQKLMKMYMEEKKIG